MRALVIRRGNGVVYLDIKIGNCTDIRVWRLGHSHGVKYGYYVAEVYEQEL